MDDGRVSACRPRVETRRESERRNPNRARKKSQRSLRRSGPSYRRRREQAVERNANAIAGPTPLGEKHGTDVAAGACHDLRRHQGHLPRHRRGPDRVHSGVLDRASAAGAALLRLRRRGLRQDLRDPDPVRRHPGAAVDLFRRAVEACDRIFHRSGAAPLRHRRAAGVPAGRGGRRASRTTSSRTCCSTNG